MRGNSIVILVVAILLGGVAAFLARNWLVSNAVAPERHGTIIVAAKKLPFGTPLTNDNIKEVPWAAKSTPPHAFSSAKELLKDGRRVTLTIIEQDEPILGSKITGPGQRATLSTLLDSDKRAITIRVDDVRGVAGFVLPNDRVDVVLIRSESGSQGRKDFSDLLLQDVKVIAVDQITSENKDRAVVAKAVTLEVSPYQAQKISLATHVGRLSLLLRKAGDSDVVMNRRVTETDLTELDRPQEPTKAPVVEKPRSPFDATVSIVRNLKSEDYKVIREGR